MFAAAKPISEPAVIGRLGLLDFAELVFVDFVSCAGYAIFPRLAFHFFLLASLLI